MRTTGTTNMPHLTENQIDDALIGDLAAEAAGHIETCAACQQKLAAARMPLQSFQALSLTWGERRSATLPIAVSQRHPHSPKTAWAAAATALLAIMVAVPFAVHQGGHSTAIDTAMMQTASAVGATGVVSGQMQNSSPNAEQIARDNLMLNEIDRELGAGSESPAALGLEVRGRSNSRASGRAVQD